MTTEQNQSAISETRDQLSLDFADGSYLNVIGANLGLSRPIFGFTDTTWRAVVKTLAINYKQIANKFRDALAIIFGPKITQVGTLAENVVAGDKTFVMNDTSNFPQEGTFIFDEGGASQETLAYCYIDRRNNTVYLVTEFSFDHTARLTDAEESIISISSTDLDVAFTNTDNFPTTDFPYPVVLSRGLSEEEVVLVTANNTVKGILTLDSSPVNSHKGIISSNIFEELLQDYFVGSTFIVLEDSTKFPSEGIVKLFPTDTFTVTVAAAAPTDRTVEVAASTFTASSLVGYEIVFDGNVTAGIAGLTRSIIDNTDSVITLSEDFGVASPFPQVGDTFELRPIVEYTSNVVSTNTLTLRKAIVESFSQLNTNSRVELMETRGSAALGSIKAQGIGWDVIQSNPRLVEILIPENAQDTNNNLSASYIHDDIVGDLSTTMSAATAGDTFIDLINNADLPNFPVAGIIVIDAGGGNQERVAYGQPVSELAQFAAAGATSIVLDDSTNFPAIGFGNINDGAGSDEVIAWVSNDTDTGTLGLVGPLSNSHKAGEVTIGYGRFLLQTPLQNSHGGGTSVDYYRPVHAGTQVPVGDPNLVIDTWRGPYIYDLESAVPTGTVAITTPSEILPGPTVLAIDQAPGRTALEVEDALSMLDISLPFIVLVGEGTSVAEQLTVTDVNIHNRASTTLAANTIIGATEIEVPSFGPGGNVGADFPNSRGYRIIIDEGSAADREVAYVTERLTAPNRLVLESPLTKAHTLGDSVTMMKDVLSVTSINNLHEGRVDLNDRSTALAGDDAYFILFKTQDIEGVSPFIDEIPATSVIGLDVTGGRVLLNYGNGQITRKTTLDTLLAAGGTTASCVSTDDFPTTSFIATIGVGLRTEEKVIVTANNTGTDDFTLGGGTYGTKYSHAVGEIVQWEPGEPELLTYSEINGSTLSFSSAIMLNSIHYPAETLIDSSAQSDPRSNGFDFPLRLPVDIRVRLEFLIDIIRAAGVQVNFIEQR